MHEVIKNSKSVKSYDYIYKKVQEMPISGRLQTSIDKYFKDTARVKALPNKTSFLTKSVSSIWVFGTSNQLFMRGS